MWSVYSGYLYEGVFSEKCIAPGIEVEKQSQVLEEKLAERCKLAKGRPCVDFKVVDVNGKEGMFSAVSYTHLLAGCGYYCFQHSSRRFVARGIYPQPHLDSEKLPDRYELCGSNAVCERSA